VLEGLLLRTAWVGLRSSAFLPDIDVESIDADVLFG
jgi:hypothetical protein